MKEGVGWMVEILVGLFIMVIFVSFLNGVFILLYMQEPKTLFDRFSKILAHIALIIVGVPLALVFLYMLGTSVLG